MIGWLIELIAGIISFFVMTVMIVIGVLIAVGVLMLVVRIVGVALGVFT